MSFVYINPQNKLKKTIKEETIIKKIIEKVGSIPKYNEYKYDLEMITMMTILVEELVNNKGKKDNQKINKKQLLMEAYKQLFNGVNSQDLTTLDNHIEYLYNNGKIVKVSRWLAFRGSCIDWIKRKIL